MAAGKRVLVVDGLSETEQVLRAVLEPRGLEVNRIRGRQAGESHTQPPSVVVLHLEDHRPDPAAEGWDRIPRVLIGSADFGQASPNRAGEHRLAKPFQYGELIGAIERLLAASAPAP